MEKFKFIALSKKLIETKILIDNLVREEKRLKKKLEPYVSPGHSLNFTKGEIYCMESKGTKSFRRKEVLQFIEEQLGKEVARRVDLNCTRKSRAVQIMCVKLKETNH
jgi:hypothetical protein